MVRRRDRRQIAQRQDGRQGCNRGWRCFASERVRGRARWARKSRLGALGCVGRWRFARRLRRKGVCNAGAQARCSIRRTKTQFMVKKTKDSRVRLRGPENCLQLRDRILKIGASLFCTQTSDPLMIHCGNPLYVVRPGGQPQVNMVPKGPGRSEADRAFSAADLGRWCPDKLRLCLISLFPEIYTLFQQKCRHRPGQVTIIPALSERATGSGRMRTAASVHHGCRCQPAARRLRREPVRRPSLWRGDG